MSKSTIFGREAEFAHLRDQYGQGNPQFQGIGVLIAGAKNVDVRNNVIMRHAPKDEVDLPPGGVVVIDTTAMGGAPPTEITVIQNQVLNNLSADLFWDGTGRNVKFARNTCRTAQPRSRARPRHAPQNPRPVIPTPRASTTLARAR